ncbi:MAG: glycosyltransferase [Proteiniphilum sp.]|jgi:glycosyltransferase involved in cell wall biosynthesis|nr:glycosyltransferase [Proteiniphilum sp.]
MKRLKTYIEKQKPEYLRVALPPEAAADIIVVIPCYNEPALAETLHNLRACNRPAANVLTVIVLNSGAFADESVVKQNRVSYEETLLFAGCYNEPGFGFFPLLFEDLPRKHAGVGLARKIGMDLAVEHFLRNGKLRGVIISLDADCTVSANFPATVWDAFSRDKSLNATIHAFRHRVEVGGSLPESAARQYEAYIRYFRSMLEYTGFPYYYHTIGSTFAVSADAYVRVGGMGRQQGGEDFYFLQKIFALGNIRELKEAWVFPMARLSGRVPFGTGPSLQKIIEEPDGNVRAYSERSFHVLKEFFGMKDAFWEKDIQSVEAMITALHPSLQQFLKEIDFQSMITDCNENSASPDTFRKRFFHHFNAFRIIKYLNRVHPDPFPYTSFASLIDKY